MLFSRWYTEYFISAGVLSCLISFFSFLILLISGLIAFCMITFIFSILNILDILDILLIGVAGITLKDDFAVDENNELLELARNSYISSLSSSVFCRFCGMIGCSVAFIFIKSVFDLSLFCLFCLFCSSFCVDVNVANNNANSSSFSICSLF